MPELPEVETVRRGLAPHLVGQTLAGARVRQSRLRWPVPTDLDLHLRGRRVRAVDRRGKYLLVALDRDYLILHLGMSGSLRVVSAEQAPGPHDHIDLLLDNGRILRMRDPRRFGALLLSADPANHPLIRDLGIEPLTTGFDGDWLYAATRGRTAPIKNLIMDAHILVGVGNIYANESLFRAGIHPLLAAGKLSRPRCARLAAAIQDTLAAAIRAGGSTLRDFVDSDGRAGYFQQDYFVYGRTDGACRQCGATLRGTRLGGRATTYCPNCQRR